MERQPLETQTLYAELLERLTAHEARRAIGYAPGTFVTKVVKGREYYYFQHLDPGGAKRQSYVGRRDGTLDAVVARFESGREESAQEKESIGRLVRQLRVGGALITDVPSGRVLQGMADAGVFQLGAVLVGTHAFLVLGNVLGVRWQGSGLRTQDLDVAATPRLSFAVPGLSADVPDVLEGLEMGFLPVPGLDPRAASTSFKVRGQGLRVDLLTSARGSAERPVRIPRLGASAQPLKYLDYVMDAPVRAAVIDGRGVLVNVPDPARFALHKLLVASARPAAMAAKRDKDVRQAGEVLAVLLADRPDDIAVAWEELGKHGSSWTKRVRTSLGGLERVLPEVASQAREALG